jgi:hypothetical protein
VITSVACPAGKQAHLTRTIHLRSGSGSCGTDKSRFLHLALPGKTHDSSSVQSAGIRNRSEKNPIRSRLDGPIIRSLAVSLHAAYAAGSCVSPAMKAPPL